MRSFQAQKFREWRTKWTVQGEGRRGIGPVDQFSPERAEPRLDRGVRESGYDGLGKALQPIHCPAVETQFR